jgi:hypothetical protein
MAHPAFCSIRCPSATGNIADRAPARTPRAPRASAAAQHKCSGCSLHSPQLAASSTQPTAAVRCPCVACQHTPSLRSEATFARCGTATTGINQDWQPSRVSGCGTCGMPLKSLPRPADAPGPLERRHSTCPPASGWWRASGLASCPPSGSLRPPVLASLSQRRWCCTLQRPEVRPCAVHAGGLLGPRGREPPGLAVAHCGGRLQGSEGEVRAAAKRRK